MARITSRKLAGIVPVWAPFRGVSLLFHNPGQSLALHGRCRVVACDVAGDPALAFYRGLADAVACLDPVGLLFDHTFCALPPASYHVTVWDGPNTGDANLPAPWADWLARLPDSLADPGDLLDPIVRMPPCVGPTPVMRFRFARLLHRTGSAVAAALEPADADSATALARLTEDRARLGEAFHRATGLATSATPEYIPHVTLGYFADRERGRATFALADEWGRTVANAVAGRELSLTGVSVHAFLDMATFLTV